MSKRKHRFWLVAGVFAGALTGLYVWQRKRRQARLPRLLEEPPGQGTALVTGASSGIGAEYARQLASRGFDVILLARRESRLRALAEELETRHGVRTEVLVADLANLDDIERVVERIETLDDLEILVNNAGFGIAGDFTEVDASAHVDMVHVHVVASMRFAHAALPRMLARDRGAIVNVSSLMAYYPLPEHVSYSGTKADLKSFTEALYQEVMGTGVRVQVLCPGFTRTEMQEKGGITDGIVPGFAWLSAEYVVEQALRDLERGEMISIPGFGYKVLAFLNRLNLRWLVYPVIHWYMRGRQGQAEGLSGFPKRTYGSLGEVMSDMQFMRQNRNRIRHAMRVIDHSFRERLMLAVTEVNGCRYCAQYHARLALESGLSQEEIDALMCGTLEDCPSDEAVGLFYAQHWADTG
ncbi:MAG: SDR family NAD(P)-dependent oxidoreductase, partial [Anaerolineae bacterium]